MGLLKASKDEEAHLGPALFTCFIDGKAFDKIRDSILLGVLSGTKIPWARLKCKNI
jgi:hypothetical protein